MLYLCDTIKQNTNSYCIEYAASYQFCLFIFYLFNVGRNFWDWK